MVCLLALAAPALAAAQPGATYRGPCDASAAVALDADHYAVANDENNIISIYRRGENASIGGLDVREFLGIRKRDEADVEGATTIGNRVYWITSHGRDGKGRAQPSRQRLFATDIRPGPMLVPVGIAYQHLLADLIQAPLLARYKFADASKRAAEAAGGLNIEGLAATPDGRLLVGFRNPLYEGRAIVVPIENPGHVIDGARARIGPAMELDLGGRGIRSMEYIGSSYWIVAGPTADEGTFALFRWSGRPGDAPQPVPVELRDLRPEALFAWPGSGTLELLSDDGGIPYDGVECKDLPLAQQTFRTLSVPR